MFYSFIADWFNLENPSAEITEDEYRLLSICAKNANGYFCTSAVEISSERYKNSTIYLPSIRSGRSSVIPSQMDKSLYSSSVFSGTFKTNELRGNF
jgi:hypothetical protein